MSSADTLIFEFESVSLNGLDSVALADRVDTKYIFHADKLSDVLGELKEHYFVLDINNRRLHSYNSLYFDTNDFTLFHQHSRGMLNRYKVRFRKYMESGLCYFEVKFKNNKGRTQKSRVKVETDSLTGDAASGLVKSATPFETGDLDEKFWVNYKRITLVSKDYKERVTLDTELTYKMNGKEIVHNDLVIAELKQRKAGISVFKNVMKRAHIHRSSLSKYCYGVVSLINNVKKNNFKEQVLNLNKRIYGVSTGY